MNTQNVNVKTATKESSERWGELPPLRGLDIRMNWVRASLMRRSDAKKAGYGMTAAEYDAETEGQHDYRAGRNTLPHLFADVQELAKAWRRGYAIAGRYTEMSACSGCNNDSGEPCPYHG
ncbi:hypothetical protein EHW64_17880 [Erwinia psidii]|uniref:hypothetical protein n=1 Tax=Erwinia psidii TaxID=69224 RepID=UPI00226B1A13|nr:hypothetical protein [Erwinia psidii]MCX8959340.1 hypothetical protein [Erwinia psidii]MCX8962933.1 hypothetical protein [Erwinia psidii]